ncbi:MAG: hypothetical protein ABSG37_11790 [Candidatus Limnocylindrales bacterium]|jgi:hypothetical protein
MRSIYIAISDDAADKLRELAQREFRAPRQQATVLVLEGLRRAGLDPTLPYDEGAEPSVATRDRAGSGPDLAMDPDARDGVR